MEIRKLNPNEISKEYRRYKIDVVNWIVHRKLSNEVVTSKLHSKNIPYDQIELLLIHGRYELIKRCKTNAKIYIITGVAIFIIGITLFLLMIESTGLGFKFFGIMAITGIISIFRGLFYYQRIKKMKDLNKMVEISEKLGQL